MSATGGMGPLATAFYSRLASMLADKHGIKTIQWVSSAVFVERLLQRFYLLTKNLIKHGEKEAANTIHHRLAGPRYMLSPAEPITITHCTSLVGLQVVAV